MSEKFERYRQKARRDALTVTAVLGVIAAVLGFSLTQLLQKAVWERAALLLPLLVGLGAGILAAAICFAVTRPHTRRLAREIDAGHLGRERLQTMLAFGDAQDAMTALQRSDTEARMEDLPLPKIGKPMWIVMIAAAAVALALLVVALVLPVNGQGPGPGPEPDTETPFTFTEWQQARLRELIAYVEGSALEESARTLAVSELNTLYNDLFAVTTRAAMLARVTGTMAVIDDKIEQINTFEEVIGALAASVDAELLTLAKAIGKVTEIPNQSELETLKAAYAEKQNGFFEALASKIEIDLTKLISYKDGALYAALERMAADLKVLDGALSAVPDPTAREILIGSTIDVCMARIADAVADQAVNRNVGDAVIMELMFIFDITQSELPASILDNGISYANPDGNYQEKDEEVSTEGGAGRDEMNYAGNDEVYDPDGDKIVQYGAIYKTYSAIMREKKNQGQLPEEYEKFITDYFSALYRGD